MITIRMKVFKIKFFKHLLLITNFILTRSFVGYDEFNNSSSSCFTLVIGSIPAGKSNKFHVIHGDPAVGTF